MSRYFTITVVVEKCNECPNFRIENHGYAEDYICTKLNKKLLTYVEWNQDVEIPEECPVFQEWERKRGQGRI